MLRFRLSEQGPHDMLEALSVELDATGEEKPRNEWDDSEWTGDDLQCVKH